MKKQHNRARCVLALISLASGTGLACGQGQDQQPPPVPRVKVEVVGETADRLTRQIAGRLESVNKASLSFGVAGTVEKVLVKEGAAVAKGQLLAQLDADEHEARARTAESRLQAANADLRERLLNLRRKEALLAEELVARAAVDALRAGVEGSRGQVRAAESEKVRRDLELRQTRIVAPMPGRVTRRNVDPFQEVLASENLFEFAGEGGLQVVIQVPDTIVRDVYYGQAATVRIPSVKEQTVQGHVSEIAAEAGGGSAFRLAIDLDDKQLDLRPGMAATATLTFAGRFENERAFLIPISALALQDMAIAERVRAEATVYVYDEASGSVRERRVRGSASVLNRLAISEGLEAGDRVVVAGVVFLHDGMSVELWEPPE